MLDSIRYMIYIMRIVLYIWRNICWIWNDKALASLPKSLRTILHNLKVERLIKFFSDESAIFRCINMGNFHSKRNVLEQYGYYINMREFACLHNHYYILKMNILTATMSMRKKAWIHSVNLRRHFEWNDKHLSISISFELPCEVPKIKASFNL